jgi:hypothetical protein
MLRQKLVSLFAMNLDHQSTFSSSGRRTTPKKSNYRFKYETNMHVIIANH